MVSSDISPKRQIGDILMSMSTQTLLTMSHYAILVGALIGAIGAFGSFYFRHKIDSDQSAKNEQRLESIQQTLDSLVTNVTAPLPTELKKKAAELASVEEGNIVALRAAFPFGYAVLDIEGNDWFVLPRTTQGSFDWSETQIIGKNSTSIKIMMPSYSVEGRKIFYNNTASISRIPGATSTPYSISGTEYVLLVLAANEDSVQVAVGVRPTPVKE